jgi:HK97 family phage prohead protease
MTTTIERSLRGVGSEKQDARRRALEFVRAERDRATDNLVRWNLQMRANIIESEIELAAKIESQKKGDTERRDTHAPPGGSNLMGPLKRIPGEIIFGYAAVYSKESHDLGGFREIIAPKAFERILREPGDVVATIDHDEGRLLARTVSRTLQLRSDATGLRFEMIAGESRLWRDAIDSIRRGDLSKCSFAFSGAKDSFRVNSQGECVRTIHDFGRLADVSIVVRPAYPQTYLGFANGPSRYVDPEVQRHLDEVAGMRRRHEEQLRGFRAKGIAV